MFPEYSDQIAKLRASDPEFAHMFEQHQALDKKIKDMEMHVELATHEKIETLKKEKLLIKDHLYVILRKALVAKG